MVLLNKINEIINRFTRLGLVLFTTIIIIFSLINIILRWFDTSLMFVDPMVRHLVFACAFLGALEATERSQNISIDVLKRYFELKEKTSLLIIVQRIVFVVSIAGCLWLAIAGYEFAIIELEYPRELFWGVNTGMAASIIPLGFLLLSIKSFLRMFIYWSTNLASLADEVDQHD